MCSLAAVWKSQFASTERRHRRAQVRGGMVNAEVGVSSGPGWGDPDGGGPHYFLHGQVSQGHSHLPGLDLASLP